MLTHGEHVMKGKVDANTKQCPNTTEPAGIHSRRCWSLSNGVLASSGHCFHVARKFKRSKRFLGEWYENNYPAGRNHYLLQGLGSRSARRLFAWLAFERGRLGLADAVSGPARLPCDRA